MSINKEINKEENMTLTANGWSNKKGTADRACVCGTWKQHWLNYSDKSWPTNCSVEGCSNTPTLGAHIRNSEVTGERIVPMCSSCNGLDTTFNLDGGVILVKANASETCAEK